MSESDEEDMNDEIDFRNWKSTNNEANKYIKTIKDIFDELFQDHT